MNKLCSFLSFVFFLGCAVFAGSCQQSADDAAVLPPVTPTEWAGADVSWMTQMEDEGHRFYSSDGTPSDLMSLLSTYGLNAVRLRVWVDPVVSGGWCDADDVLRKALRARQQQMDILLDFHYSDDWADPSRQSIPAAWRGHSYEQLKEDVAAHTRQVLSLLKAKGVVPRWVQVGNETSNGFLWPVGKADTHPEQYAGLFLAGYDAVKAVCPETAVLVHLDNGPDWELHRWNLDLLKQYGAKWDMVGLSVYPYWSVKNGSCATADEVIDRSVENLRRVQERYGCDVMVVETGMECADDNGRLAGIGQLRESKRQLRKLLDGCRLQTEGHCKGVFYWEPECLPSRYRLGAFTEEGRPTLILDAFRENAD